MRLRSYLFASPVSESERAGRAAFICRKHVWNLFGELVEVTRELPPLTPADVCEASRSHYGASIAHLYVEAEVAPKLTPLTTLEQINEINDEAVSAFVREGLKPPKHFLNFLFEAVARRRCELGLTTKET